MVPMRRGLRAVPVTLDAVERGDMTTDVPDVRHPVISSGTIVVGVDGSEHAARAVDWATRQAAMEHRPLTLLHGFDPVARTTLGALELDGADRFELIRDLRRAARIALDEAADWVHEVEPHVTVDARLVDADARQALVDASRTAHLIVVGSRGRGAVTGLLLGSVSVAVAQLSACPVVVCRPRHGDLATRGVLVGADGSAESAPVIDFAFRQASLRGVPLTVMHCFWEITAADAAASHDAKTAPTDVQLLLAESVAGFAETYPDVEVRTELARGLVDQALAGAAPTTDLLVVGRRDKRAIARLFHASMAAAVLEQAAGTVAVIPEAPALLV
jgi:nucleotide-binding universal stress UspA family protein